MAASIWNLVAPEGSYLITQATSWQPIQVIDTIGRKKGQDSLRTVPTILFVIKTHLDNIIFFIFLLQRKALDFRCIIDLWKMHPAIHCTHHFLKCECNRTSSMHSSFMQSLSNQRPPCQWLHLWNTSRPAVERAMQIRYFSATGLMISKNQCSFWAAVEIQTTNLLCEHRIS